MLERKRQNRPKSTLLPQFVTDSSLEGGGFELPVPRADGTQDTALHGGNPFESGGDASVAVPAKINDLELAHALPMYRPIVYFLYRIGRVDRRVSARTNFRPTNYPRTNPPSTGITAPVT
jgi:hypothetical protein